MKKLYNLLLIGAAALTMAGCSLDMKPETTLTDDAYWKTEGDLRGACNRFYQQLNGNNALGGGFSHDYRSDELNNNGAANNISDGSWTIPSTSGSWSDAYWRIFIANNILQKGKTALVSDEVRNKYFAEACFFRAYYYFELVKKYGDVPLLLKAVDDTQDPELEMPRTSRDKVIAQVYDDLEFAAQWLPDVDKVDSWGHVTRQAAQAMIVRVGLHEGTFCKYHSIAGIDYKVHLKKAIDTAETLMKSGKHDLYPDFEKLFTFDGEGRKNKEAIFVKVYGPNGAGTTTHGNSRQLENATTLTRNMVDLFLYTDGLPREKSPLKIANETSLDDIFVNRDPRLGMTVYKVGEEAYKGAYVPFSFRYGYNIKKGFMLDEWTTVSKETVDKMIIRYAEVLIAYAEALYEYNGSITDSQLDATVNALRQRAGMPAMLTNSFVTANGLNMLEEIRRERTIEFIDENKRYDDIIRWKIAEKVLPVDIIGGKWIEDEMNITREELANRLTSDGGMNQGKKRYDQDDFYVLERAEDRRFDPAKDYYYPIPLKEITLSGNNVVQNPNWK